MEMRIKNVNVENKIDRKSEKKHIYFSIFKERKCIEQHLPVKKIKKNV